MEHLLRYRERAVIFTLVLAVALQLPVAASESQNTNALDFANGLYARKMYGPAITEYAKFLKTNPHSPESASARFRYADSYYFTKDYASAIAHFELFLKEYSTDKRVSMAHFRLGTARFYQGNVAMAIRELTELSRDEEDPVLKSGALFYLAKALEEKGAAARSLEIFRKLAAQEGDSEYATYAGVAIGDAHLKAEDLEAALREGYLPAAKRSAPAALVHQAQFKVAEIYFSRKQYAEAAPFYEQVIVASDAPELREKALLGLFYCDYYESDLERAERRYSMYQPLVDSSAQRPEIGFLFASLLADKKKYPEAIAKLEAVIADPQADASLKEKSQFKKISVLSEMGQKELSLKTLEEYFGSASQSADKALSQKGELLAEIGKTDEAIAVFQKLRQDFPVSPYAKSALYQTAVALSKAGRFAEAKKSFGEYAERYPDDPDADLALLQIIQTDLDAKDFNAAFEGAEKMIKDKPQSPRLDIAYYKLGVAATGLGRFGHAAFAFKKVTDDFSSSKLYVESLYGTAVSLENARKLDEAIPAYERLLRDHPEHALAKEVLPRLGYLYIQNQDTGKALTHYEDLIFPARGGSALGGKKTDVPLETDGIFWVVQYLLDQGLYDRLERILDALPARFPDKDLKHETIFFKAERAMGIKDYAAAKALYAEAIQASPTEGRYVPHAYLGLGTAEGALGEDAEAAKNFSEALRFDEEVKVSMRARFELANLRLKSKDYEAAAKDFMLVAILYDDEKYTPPALYKAGECFLSTGKKEDAEKAFLELKTKYPNSVWAKKAS